MNKETSQPNTHRKFARPEIAIALSGALAVGGAGAASAQENPGHSPLPESNTMIMGVDVDLNGNNQIEFKEIMVNFPAILNATVQRAEEIASEIQTEANPEPDLSEYTLEGFLALPNKKLTESGFKKIIKKNSKELAKYYKENGYPDMTAAMVQKIETRNLSGVKKDPRFNVASSDLISTAIITLKEAQKAARAGNIDEAKALKNKADAYYRVSFSVIDFGNKDKKDLEIKFRKLAEQFNFE